MDVVKPLRFQPTVVVCVGPPGRAVRDELALLLPSMDSHRRAGIAFLSVDGDLDTEQRILASRYDPDAGDMLDSAFFPGGTANAGQAGNAPNAESQLLTTLMVEALRGQSPTQNHAQTPRGATDAAGPLGVLDDKIIQQIKDDGYAVPDAQVVVWIVVSPQSPWLGPVTHDVRRALTSERVSSKVLLALPNIYDSDLDKHDEQVEACRNQRWDVLLGAGDTASGLRTEPLADFAYVFEARDEQGFYNNDKDHPNDIAFAIAEVIFILMTTGVLSTPELNNILRGNLRHLQTSPIERMGGAGSSRLTFPRAHIELYCASRMAATIVSYWAPKETQSDQRALQALVAEQTNASSRWVTRFDGAPNRETSSTNTVIKALRARSGNRTKPLNLPSSNPDGDLVFRHFSQHDLAQLEQGERDLPLLLRTQRAKAEDGFRYWRSTIGTYWKWYEDDMLAELNAFTKNDVLMEAGGVERTRLFFKGLDRAMGIAKDKLASARVKRELDYETFLTEMSALGRNGPWAALLPTRNIEVEDPNQVIGPQQPRGQHIDPAQRVSSEDDQNQADGEDDNAAAAGPVSREDQIILQLASRYRWYARNQANATSIAPVAAMTTPPTVLLEVALLSLSIPFLATPVGIVTLTILTFMLLNFGGRFLLPKHHEYEDARNDLINFHRRMFRHETRIVEDEEREALLVGLHVEVRYSLERLEHWEAFVASLSETLENQANQIERNLFERAIGRRDIFVANQRILTIDGYRMRQLEIDIARRREEHPKPGKDWHARNGEIVRHMRDQMPETVSFLKSSQAQIVRPIFTFCRSIVREYLDGPISDIGMALHALPSADQAGLFSKLIQRSLILYLPQISLRRSPLLFISSRDEYRLYLKESALTRDAVMMRIQDHDWLGTIRISHGGEAPSFWTSQINSPANVPAVPTWPSSTRGYNAP